MSVQHSTQNKIKFKFKHQRGTFQSFQRSNFLAQESALEPIEQRVPYHRSWEIRSVCPTTVQCATVFPTTVYHNVPYHSLPRSTTVCYSLPQCTTMYPTTDLEDSISVLAEKKHPWTVSTPRTEIFPIGLSSSPSLSLSLWWGLSASSRNVLHHSFLAPLIAPCCYIHLFIHFHHHHFSIYYWASRSEFDRKAQKTGWTVWTHQPCLCLANI